MGSGDNDIFWICMDKGIINFSFPTEKSQRSSGKEPQHPVNIR